MRAILTSSGAAGDIWPFLALGTELRRHGHAPILASAPHLAPFAERQKLPFVPLGAELDMAMLRTLSSEMFAASGSAKQMNPLLAAELERLPDMFRQLVDLCRDADVIICGTGQPIGQMIHETIGIPFVSIHTTNFALWGSTLARQATAQMINLYRARLGLPTLRDVSAADSNTPLLVLYAVSRYTLRLPRQWPANHHVIGYFFLDDDEPWTPAPALAEFVASGEPPVVISFGSMLHADPAQVTQTLLDGVAQAGCRAILQQGWSGLGQLELPANVHGIGFVPHSWLFPRAGCVVHHGATGTTGATLRAGVPSVVVPHAYEHPLNAELLRELACAGPPIPFAKLTAERLGSAISATLSSPRYHEAAAALGEKVRAEQGVQMARQLIEQSLAA